MTKTRKFQFSVHSPVGEFRSSPIPMTSTEHKQWEDLLYKGLDSFFIEYGDFTHFFGKDLLRNSVITIIDVTDVKVPKTKKEK